MFVKLVTSLALILTLGACNPQKMAFHGVDITGAEYAKELNLTDQNGQPRTLKDFAGKVVVVFFGYTQCPDVCPTTLQELADGKADDWFDSKSPALIMIGRALKTSESSSSEIDNSLQDSQIIANSIRCA